MTCPITADRDAWRGDVTQADRDVVNHLRSQLLYAANPEISVEECIVQAFARHRLAAEASFKAREDALVEALEAVLNESGARGRYHALRYIDAVERAEELLAARAHTATDAGGE